MKLSELLKLDQEGRDREYMRLHGLTEVDPIGILETILADFQADPNGEILLEFARELKKQLDVVLVQIPEGTIRGELDVEGGAE